MITKLFRKLFGIKEKEPFLKIGDRAWHRYTPEGFCVINKIMVCREGRIEGYLIAMEDSGVEKFVEHYCLCKIISGTENALIGITEE